MGALWGLANNKRLLAAGAIGGLAITANDKKQKEMEKKLQRDSKGTHAHQSRYICLYMYILYYTSLFCIVQILVYMCTYTSTYLELLG